MKGHNGYKLIASIPSSHNKYLEVCSFRKCPPVVSTSHYSHPCVNLFPWVCECRLAFILLYRMWQKWQHLTSEVRSLKILISLSPSPHLSPTIPRRSSGYLSWWSMLTCLWGGTKGGPQSTAKDLRNWRPSPVAIAELSSADDHEPKLVGKLGSGPSPVEPSDEMQPWKIP